ncbi:hypothetical protein [Actinocorallia sp. A-T 12471]|uniref:hypothetical protein n=1 Tax=Actinocorallia sp. A-T 12471 TaxID=3089813 RepID=UPI0029CFB81C|nr:hypothetical protein [Actinocorallia sp. A-T 12471]MDX6739918.1 hypothetical protein [Actinocorallia sp. A-T 12471]
MDETLVLPVPARLRAVCLVAAPLGMPVGIGSGALALVEPVAAGVPPLPWLTGPSGHCARCVPGGLDVDAPLVRRIREADFHLRVSALGDACWPPSHVTEAAAVGFELAEETGGILLDAVTGDVDPWAGPPEPFDVPEGFAAAEWVGVHAAPGPRGRGWTLTTAGLTVLGLPELRVARIPAALRRSWADVLCGLAQVLLRAQWADLEEAPGCAFREIPAEVRLTAADVGRATAGCPHGAGSALLRLRLDPGTPNGPPTRLTIVAPSERHAADGAYPPDGHPPRSTFPDDVIARADTPPPRSWREAVITQLNC